MRERIKKNIEALEKRVFSVENICRIAKFFRVFKKQPKIKKSIECANIKRILVIRLDQIGDIVLFSPFLREIRNLFPDAWVTLIVKPEIYDFLILCPYVNEILTYEWKASIFTQSIRHWRAFRMKLWRKKFDLAIVPRWHIDLYHASFLAYYSGAPYRVAYSEKVNAQKAHFNFNYDKLFTHLISDPSPKHSVEYNLDVIRFLGGRVKTDKLEIWINPEDNKWADNFLMAQHLDNKNNLVAFGIGAGENNRLWPAERFARIGDWLVDRFNTTPILIGSSQEQYIASSIKRCMKYPPVNTVGKITLRQAAALLSRCNLFVGHNSGPLHIASAMGVPAVLISGPTDLGAFSPRGSSCITVSAYLDCSPCELPTCKSAVALCMDAITIEQVQEAIEKHYEKF